MNLQSPYFLSSVHFVLYSYSHSDSLAFLNLIYPPCLCVHASCAFSIPIAFPSPSHFNSFPPIPTFTERSVLQVPRVIQIYKHTSPCNYVLSQIRGTQKTTIYQTRYRDISQSTNYLLKEPQQSRYATSLNVDTPAPLLNENPPNVPLQT